MSNLNYEAALKYIDLGSYDKAVEKLNLAIDEESSKDNDIRATEYRCVLGELFAQLGKEEEAREEFTQVIQFADENRKASRRCPACSQARTEQRLHQQADEQEAQMTSG